MDLFPWSVSRLGGRVGEVPSYPDGQESRTDKTDGRDLMANAQTGVFGETVPYLIPPLL